MGTRGREAGPGSCSIFSVVDLVSLALLISFGASYVFISQEWWALLIFVLLIVMALVTVTVIWRQPVSKIKLDFKVSGHRSTRSRDL